MNDQQLLKTIDAIVTHVKTNGEFIKPKFKSMGGMWSSDRYQYQGVNVLIADGGYSRIVTTDVISAYVENDRVVLAKGTFDELLAVKSHIGI